MGDEYRLQLDIGLQAHAFQQVGDEGLVGEVRERSSQVVEVEVGREAFGKVMDLAADISAVEHSATRPVRPFVVADGDGTRAVGALDLCARHASL